MDQTDLQLCAILQSNSRTPYHELASHLGLSVNAVHKRIKELNERGIIRAFRARPSLEAVRAVNVWVFGRSDSTDLDHVHLRLQKNDSTYWVALSGGGFVYVGGYLKDIADLDDYASFVKERGEIKEPTIGLLPSAPKRPKAESLQSLDYEIIASLHDDSRKPLSEVAKDIGVSPKTVRRRLEWMVEKRLVDMTIDWYPDASNDIIGMCHITIQPEVNKMALSTTTTDRFRPNVLSCVPLSNLPNQLVAFLWTNTMKQMEELKDRIRVVGGVKSVALNVLQIGYMSDTWRDKLLLEKV